MLLMVDPSASGCASGITFRSVSMTRHSMKYGELAESVLPASAGAPFAGPPASSHHGGSGVLVARGTGVSLLNLLPDPTEGVGLKGLQQRGRFVRRQVRLS